MFLEGGGCHGGWVGGGAGGMDGGGWFEKFWMGRRLGGVGWRCEILLGWTFLGSVE